MEIILRNMDFILSAKEVIAMKWKRQNNDVLEGQEAGVWKAGKSSSQMFEMSRRVENGTIY